MAVSKSGARITNLEYHRQKAVDSYQAKRSIYEIFASEIERILRVALMRQNIKVASIEGRAKDVESFGKKASVPSPLNPELPKYKDPINEITDQAGVRVITFFPKTIDQVDQVVNTEFCVREKSDKADTLKLEDRFGYQSVHYLVSLKSDRTPLPEYAQFKDLIAEIQVRTILQHAWAEIEHDIQYKSSETIPTSIHRRFMSLAGLFEIADREFQAIQDDDKELRLEARNSVREGKLEAVEITPDALKAYLDKKLGPDGRMTNITYDWTTRLLLKFGFTNFRQIDDCIAGYNDDRVSRLAWGERQGQVLRFETLLLAGMGSFYIEKHPLAVDDGWVRTWQNVMHRLVKGGIGIKDHLPYPMN
jgi:ppGpp synthetase/RelA/SpoT-type nucleotidyltranferase